jgi:hypothetical protein
MDGFVMKMHFCSVSRKIVAMVSPVLRFQPFRRPVARNVFESSLLVSSMDHHGPTFVEGIRRGVNHRRGLCPQSGLKHAIFSPCSCTAVVTTASGGHSYAPLPIQDLFPVDLQLYIFLPCTVFTLSCRTLDFRRVINWLSTLCYLMSR